MTIETSGFLQPLPFIKSFVPASPRFSLPSVCLVQSLASVVYWPSLLICLPSVIIMQLTYYSLLASAAALLSATPASAQNTSTTLKPINYGAFTQTATYSVANQLGFFKAYGLNVTYLQVPNSTYGYAQLLNGGYDIMTGTIDNAVNLRFNQNQSLTVTGQLDGGPELTIASIPNITNITQLKGKSLMVDSPVSGYAYILRKVLALYGLLLENGDYTFQVRTVSDHNPSMAFL